MLPPPENDTPPGLPGRPVSTTASSRLLPRGKPLPLYRERAQQRAADYPEALQALDGEPASALRVDRSGDLVLSVAVPVQRYRQVLGAVMLSVGGDAIDAAVRDVRLNILKVFGVAFAVTVLLSLYLAGTIARPIRRLAEAADRVRRGQGRQIEIPDFTRRGDEIGDLSGALREMTEALWTRMDAIEHFAADVAHEIKNPLSSLRSAVETVARIEDPEQQRRLMAIILDDVQRLDRLITDISDASPRRCRAVARAKRSRSTSAACCGPWSRCTRRRPSPTARASSSMRRAAAPSMVAGNREPPRPGVAQPDRQCHLLQPAGRQHHASSPGATAGASGRQRRRSGARAFPPDKLEAIFDRFYTERPAGEKFGTHSGLGLTISQQIVEAHGGRIFAENLTDPDGSDPRRALHAPPARGMSESEPAQRPDPCHLRRSRGRGRAAARPPGTGKSDLALRLIDGGGALVADDLCEIRRDGRAGCWPICRQRWIPAFRGRIELRGIGFLTLPYAGPTPLALVVDLEPGAPAERLPIGPRGASISASPCP